jgi:paraquat-inducible protein B
VTEISVVYDLRDLSFHIPVVIEIDGSRFITVGIADADLELDDESRSLRLIEKGLRARLNVQSFVTGLLEVELDFFPDTQVVYRGEGPPFEVPTIPSTAQVLAERVQKFVAQLQDVPVEDLVKDLTGAARGLDELVNSEELANSLAGAERLLNSEDTQALSASLRRSLSGFDATMADARQLVDTADEGLEPALAELNATLDDVRSAVGESKMLLEAVRRDLTGQSDTYHRIAAALAEVEAAARSFRVLADYLERHPEALLRGKPSP